MWGRIEFSGVTRVSPSDSSGEALRRCKPLYLLRQREGTERRAYHPLWTRRSLGPPESHLRALREKDKFVRTYVSAHDVGSSSNVLRLANEEARRAPKEAALDGKAYPRCRLVPHKRRLENLSVSYSIPGVANAGRTFGPCERWRATCRCTEVLDSRSVIPRRDFAPSRSSGRRDERRGDGTDKHC